MSATTVEQDEAPVSWALRFTLADWDTRASVRSSQHDYLLPDDVPQQLLTRY